MALVIHLEWRRMSFVFDSGARTSVESPMLAGPFSKAFEVDPLGYTSVLGVQFKPGAARAFFPIPSDELHNVDVPLDDLYLGEGTRLKDQVGSAVGIAEQVRVVERYLEGKLGHAMCVHPAVRHALGEFARRPGVVADVVAGIGVSHTRFIQLFRESVGLTPKLYCRIQRFQKVLAAIERGRESWAELASECGYFDQAHLIHEFRAFSGTTPSVYLDAG
jgi:AraC-like DNA-binding protein